MTARSTFYFDDVYADDAGPLRLRNQQGTTHTGRAWIHREIGRVIANHLDNPLQQSDGHCADILVFFQRHAGSGPEQTIEEIDYRIAKAQQFHNNSI